MPFVASDYYRTHLAVLHQRLLNNSITRTYLTGTGIRLDGMELMPGDRFELPFGTFSTIEFAHLFSIFDGSRVHQQAQKSVSMDDAPPGLYFTVVHRQLLQSGHKNRLGIFRREGEGIDLFIEDMHIDHYFLNERQTPPVLGTLAFALCAITAHLAGMGRITLIAADGQRSNSRYVGFKVWPKFGFDAPLLPGEVQSATHLAGCTTVQDVIALDEPWWEVHGSQRQMIFDLSAESPSWQKLIPYVTRKISTGSTP